MIRSSSRRGRLAAVAAVVCLFAVAACTENGTILDPEPPAPPTFDPVDTLAVGACLQSEEVDARGDFEISEDAVVECEEPHSVEVTGVVRIPWRYFAEGVPSRADYRDLTAALAGGSETRHQYQFRVWAAVVCEGSLQRAVGLDHVEVDGTSAVRSRIVPFDRMATTVPRLEPYAVWEAEPRLVCVQRFHEPAAETVAAPARTVTGFDTSSFLTQDYPIEARWCTDADDNRVDCTETHHAERTFTFDATRVLGEDDIETVRTARAEDDAETLDEWIERLSEFCTETHDVIIGQDWDAENLTGVATLGSGWAATSSSPTVVCAVTAADPERFDLPAGSVIGLGESTITPVPR